MTRITFEVDSSQLAYTNLARELVIDPHAYADLDVFAGFDSNDRSPEGSFEVTGEPRSITGAKRSYLSTAVVESITGG